MSKYPPILEKIIKEAEVQKKQGRPLKAIFDLDSTLFDVSPRISEIFHSFAHLPEIRLAYPREAEILAAMEPDPKDYGVRIPAARHGLPQPGTEFFKILVDYWKTYFFSDQYLKHDKPYSGARQFVDRLFQAGADIIYLTGRDTPRMRDGTIQSLRQHGFPLDTEHANLHLKPTKEVDDGKFKMSFFEKMDHASGPVWFFENEPVNIHLVLNGFSHIKIVFVETVHSQNASPPPDSIPKISGWFE